MKTDNRGFTLIEMLVCLVIFAIVVGAAYGFMMTGALSFNRINNNVDLQIKSDITMNQLSKYLMNCSAGVSFKNNTLFVVNEDASAGSDGKTGYTAKIFQLKDDHCIYFVSVPAVMESDGSFSCVYTASDLLAKNTQSLNISLVSNTDGASVVSAKIEAVFSYAGNSLTSGRTVALRNHPLLITIS